MGLTERIIEQRERQIAERAKPYLSDGEEIVQWVRARRPQGRGDGYLFLTPTKFVLHWDGPSDGSGSVEWGEIKSWGVDRQVKGGPLLGIATEEKTVYVKMPVVTRGMADRVSGFLNRFSRLAPEPQMPLTDTDGQKDLEHRGKFKVSKEKRSVADHTKRVIVTVVGFFLVIGGILITPLPGPWSFPIVLAGLALLASEYIWAADVLTWTKSKYKKTAAKLRAGRQPSR